MATDQARTRFVSRDDLGDRWPLTVESGELRCEPVDHPSLDLASVTFTTGGVTYALNGTAKSRNAGQDITEIWADWPDGLELKKNIGPLIDLGLDLCT